MIKGDFEWKSHDGTEMYSRTWQPDGEAVAAVTVAHGHGEHSGRYEHIAAHFAALGFATHAFDHRGHGKSRGKKGHTPGYSHLIQDTRMALEHTREKFGAIPQILYGHSMGGNLAANYLIRQQPELAAAIISSPWLRLAFAPPGIKVFMGKLMRGIFPGYTERSKLNVQHISRDPVEVKKYSDDPMIHDKISAELGMSMMESGEYAIENAGKIKVPVLLMHGTGDQITSHEASKEFFGKITAKKELALWEGFYHETHNEPEKAKVLAKMSDWIRSNLPVPV